MDDIVLRDGIPIEKGVVLTKDSLDRNQELFTNYLNYWLLYPDELLDAIQDSEDAKHFHLFGFQRIALRASLRYRYHSMTATRATSKSFIAYLAAFLRCILLPNSNIVIASDVKGTVVKIAEAKFEEIFRHWPLLRAELKTRADDGKQGEKAGKDYFELYVKNGSSLTVVSKDKSRGIRTTALVLEESATMDQYNYTEVLLPQLNIKRKSSDGSLNPEEPSSPQTFITTAASKTTFMYGKLIEMVVDEVLRPEEVFVWGSSYEMPLHYGLIDRATIMDQRYSTTMDEDSFARKLLREYIVIYIKKVS